MTQLLDCTFRDGGYYTNWEFDTQLVSDYLNYIKLKHIEIGYVCADRTGEFGNVSAHTIGKFRQALPDAYLYLMSDYPMFSSKEDVKKLYFELPCNCVRIAVNFDKIENSRFIFEELKELGFETSINISKFYLLDDLQDTIRALDKWSCVDIIYLADSFGSIHPEDLRDSIRICKDCTSKKLGFHGHDSQGLAAYNSLVSLEEGVHLVDCTVAGMGKGSGNAATEEMLEYVGGHSLTGLALQFQELKKEFGWGKSFLYFVASRHEVNPTYVYRMIQEGFSSDRILKIIPKIEKHFEFKEEVYDAKCNQSDSK